MLSFIPMFRFSASLILIFLASCSQADVTEMRLAILNDDDYANSGDLEIEVCAEGMLELAELEVNIYVTENKNWEGSQGFGHYFDSSRVGIPGKVSTPIAGNSWSPTKAGCNLASLVDIFPNSADWANEQQCPFKAIIVVASYRTSSINKAKIIQCKGATE